MEYLPNNNSSFFGQEPPVVFFAAGPPTQGSHGRNGTYFQARRTRGDEHPKSSWDFISKLAFVILSLFAVSMVMRIVLHLVAFVFSPPVLFLCLVTLVLSNSRGWPYTVSSNDWNAREFQRCFHNPQRHFRRFFNIVGRTSGAGECGPARYRTSGSGGRNTNRRASSEAAAGAAASPRPASTNNTNQSSSNHQTTNDAAAQSNRPTSPNHEFELVSPFHLMMAAAAANATANNNNNDIPASTSNSNEEDSSKNDEETIGFSQHQKVPVHRQENDKELVISMDISGFNPSDLQITIENESTSTTLCIRGERVNKIGDRFAIDESFHLDVESFDLESVSATASDGVLQVQVKKKEAPQPRIISIQAKKED